MRKSLGWLLAAILVWSTILAGCSQSGADSNKITVAAVAGTESAPIKKMLPQFEKQTGKKVEFIEMPYNTLYEKVLNDLTSGTGTYDVIFIDDPWFPMFAGGGYLTPLKELGYKPDPDFVQTSLDVSKWPAPKGPRLPGDDKGAEPELYALPAVGNVQMFFYREDIAKKEGIGKIETWDDLEKAIAKVKKKDFYGFVPRAARGNPVVTNFNPFLWSHGGDIFDENWNVRINDEKGVEALEFYLKLVKQAPPGVANYDADEVANTMLQDKAFSAIVWPAWASQMDDPNKSKVVGKIGFSLVPKKERYAPQLGNWLLAIPKESDNQEWALQFIQWATSKEVQKEGVAYGGIPTRKSVLTDPELTKKYRYLPAVKEGLENAIWRPRTPEWAEVENILGIYLSKAVTGEMSAKEALDTAAKQITDLMKRRGYHN